jgi:hypothetical protein
LKAVSARLVHTDRYFEDTVFALTNVIPSERELMFHTSLWHINMAIWSGDLIALPKRLKIFVRPLGTEAQFKLLIIIITNESSKSAKYYRALNNTVNSFADHFVIQAANWGSFTTSLPSTY